jgi:hypothetical protein
MITWRLSFHLDNWLRGSVSMHTKPEFDLCDVRAVPCSDSIYIWESYPAETIIGYWCTNRPIGVASWFEKVKSSVDYFLSDHSLTSLPDWLKPLCPVTIISFWMSRECAKFVPTLNSNYGFKEVALMSNMRAWRSSLVCMNVLSQIHLTPVAKLRSIVL